MCVGRCRPYPIGLPRTSEVGNSEIGEPMKAQVRHVGTRARRTAIELAVALDKMRDDEEFDGNSPWGEPSELAAGIDSDWASIVLLAYWNSLREPTEPVRPHAKRALGLLRSTSDTGSSRALNDVAQLIATCWLSHEANAIELAPIWESKDSDQAVSILISGSSLPTAIDAVSLMSNPHSSLLAIAEIISRKTDPESLFTTEEFPHLSQLPAAGEAGPIWLGLYLRISLIIHLAPLEPDLAPISEQFSTQFYSELGGSRALGYPEIRSMLLNLDEDIAAYPVVESAGVCWSSAYLLADSIAPWLLSAIQLTNLREQAISQPFEDKVVQLMRAHGFKAGSVDDKGTWSTQSGKERLHCGERLPGQIDVLATRDDAVFVLECKSIFSMGKIRNIAEKLGLDGHDWRTRLGKKRDWSRKVLEREIDLSMIVVEGIEIYASERELTVEIPLLTFESLSEVLDTAHEMQVDHLDT